MIIPLGVGPPARCIFLETGERLGLGRMRDTPGRDIRHVDSNTHATILMCRQGF